MSVAITSLLVIASYQELLLGISVEMSKVDLGRKAKLLPFFWTSLQQWELMPVIRELKENDGLGSCFSRWLRRMIVQIFLPFKYLFFSHPGILERGGGC